MEKNRQKLRPFLSREKRFELTHSFINGNDLDLSHKMHITKYKKDNLSEGLAKFINVNKKRSTAKDNFNKKYKIDYYNIRKKFKVDYNKIDFTKRVILPQKNTEKVPPTKLRIYTQLGKELLRVGEGSYKSLMVRTPVSFPIRGRKRINKSFDSGNKPDSELFWEDKIEECSKDNNRLFGVERKYRAKLINAESKIEPYRFGRKHFFGKIKDTKIF